MTTSPVGKRAFLEDLLLGDSPAGTTAAPACAFDGSHRVSRENLDGTCLVTDVVMRFVTTVCFLPPGLVTVILSPLESFLRVAFLLAIADCVLVAVARPGPIPRRSRLVRPKAVSEDNNKRKKLQ